MKKIPAIAVVVLSLASRAATAGDLTIALHGALGFDGKWVYDWDIPGSQTMPTNLFDREGDYALTVGVGSFFDYALTNNVSLGMDVHFLWWQTQRDANAERHRDGRLEFGPSVRFGFEVMESLRLYLRFAPGMTIIMYQDDPRRDTDIGYNLALLGGATYRFTRNLGVMLEFGAIFHMYFGEVAPYSYMYYGIQPHLNCGMFFSF